MRNWRLFPSTAGKLTSSLNFRATDSAECRNCVPARPDDFSARFPTSTPNRWRPTPTLVPLSWRNARTSSHDCRLSSFLVLSLCHLQCAQFWMKSRTSQFELEFFQSFFLTVSERRCVGKADLGEVEGLSQRCFCSESRNWSQKGQSHIIRACRFLPFSNRPVLL